MKSLLFFLLLTSIFLATALNPITALLSLVLFISLTIPFFFVVFNFEYFGFLFLIVYLGALIVLFLFVIISLDVRVRQEQFKLPLLTILASFTIYTFIEMTLNSNFDSTVLSSFGEFEHSTLNSVWPHEDIDFYVYAYNELGFLIIIAAVILILSLLCVIIIGDFIKKL